MSKKFDEMYGEMVGIDSVSAAVFRALGVIPCVLNRPDIDNFGYFELFDAFTSATRVLSALPDVDPRIEARFRDAKHELGKRLERFGSYGSVIKNVFDY